jgi:hypothetical protein
MSAMEGVRTMLAAGPLVLIRNTGSFQWLQHHFTEPEHITAKVLSCSLQKAVRKACVITLMDHRLSSMCSQTEALTQIKTIAQKQSQTLLIENKTKQP